MPGDGRNSSSSKRALEDDVEGGPGGGKVAPYMAARPAAADGGQLLVQLQLQCLALWDAVKQPQILLPAVFVFCWQASGWAIL